MRKRVLITAAAVAVIGATAVAAVGVVGGTSSADHAPVPPKTVVVTKESLVDYEDVIGKLSYGEPVPLRYVPAVADPPATDTDAGTGTGTGTNVPPKDDGQKLVTWLAPIGSTVERGKPVLRVDDRPVVLLFGELPAYRTLTTGVQGRDVRQLEENLKGLGYSGFTVDETFSASTATAVKAWQKAAGLIVTGSVAPGQVLFTGGPIRVAAHQLRIGDRADGEVLRYTGTARAVGVALPTRLSRYAQVGGAVSVVLPDGKSVDGTISSVGGGPGADADPPPPGEPTTPVLITVADQAALGGLRDGDAKVRFVADERTDVLTVPVVALVALAEGGYGLQVSEGGSTRYIAVRTGLFARGRVEVSGPEVRAGLTVVVPG